MTPPRSGSGVSNFHTRWPVFTSIALIEPWSCQPCERGAEVAVLHAEEDVAEDELVALLRGRQLRLHELRRRLGRGVEHVVRRRVVRGRRVVEAADRRGVDRDRLARLQRRMLDPVDHLDALVERLARVGVEGVPDALHRGDGDDVVRLAADLAVVHERRLRDVVRPLVARDQLLPPLRLTRSSGRRRSASRCADPRPGGSTGSTAASPSRSRRTRCRSSASIVTGVQTLPPPTMRLAARQLCLLRRDRPVRARPGGPQIRSCTPSRTRACRTRSRQRRRPRDGRRTWARSSRSSRSSSRRRARRAAIVHALDQVPVGRVERVDVHVERQQEELAVAGGHAAGEWVLVGYQRTPSSSSVTSWSSRSFRHSRAPSASRSCDSARSASTAAGE